MEAANAIGATVKAGAGVEDDVGSASGSVKLLFGDIRSIFVFGDSYSENSYEPSKSLSPTSPDQILLTTAGGMGWVEYLASMGNETSSSFYSFAQSGACTNNSILHTVDVDGTFPIDITAQISEFTKWFVPSPEAAPWDSSSALFAIWIGFNDISAAYIYDHDYASHLPAIIESFANHVDTLHTAGARHFLIVNVPPIDLTPLIVDDGPFAQQEFRTNTQLYNGALEDFVKSVSSTYPDSSFVFQDTNTMFTNALDSPLSGNFQDTTNVCPQYNSDYPPAYDAACLFPFSQYFWHTSVHPTSSVQKLVAEQSLQLLSS